MDLSERIKSARKNTEKAIADEELEKQKRKLENNAQKVENARVRGCALRQSLAKSVDDIAGHKPVIAAPFQRGIACQRVG